MAEPVLVVRVAANITELRKNLLEGTSTIETTKAAMTSMADSFDGSKIIAQSGAVMANIQKLGGISTLTATEQTRANRILEEALDKYKALGREAPPGMEALAVATRSAGAEVEGLAPKTSNLTTSFRQFDSVLASLGIHIGPEIKALGEMGNVISSGTVKIDGIARAGLAFGAGVAGWKVGRLVMEFFDLDKAVAKAWTSLLGYADLAAETAGSKQDVINRAIAAGAKETISYIDAIKFLTEEVKRNADAKIDWAQRLSDAQREVRNLSDSTKTQIEVAQKAGATTEQITNKYHVSADALKVLADRKKLATDASKQHEEAQKKEKAATEAYNVELAKQRVLFDNLDKEAAASVALKSKTEAAQGWINAMERSVIATNQQKAAEVALYAEQGSGLTIIGQTSAELAKVGPAAKSATDSAIHGFAGVSQQITLTGDALKEYINLMRYSAQANAILSENSLYTSQSQRERVAALPSPRASGGPVSAGSSYMVGERGPELFVPERSGSIVPNGAAGGVTLAPTLNFHGPVIGSSGEFEAMVSAALLNVVKMSGGQLPSSVQ